MSSGVFSSIIEKPKIGVIQLPCEIATSYLLAIQQELVNESASMIKLK